MIPELLLIATCILGPGALLRPPPGWVMTEVITAGTSHYMVPPQKETTVKLQRTVTIGETVEAPQGCTLTSTAQPQKAGTP